MLDRFADPSLQHMTRHVASDGSLKVGPRLLGTAAKAVRPALAAAGVSEGLLDEPRFTGLVESWYARLAAAGVKATIREAAAGG